MIIKKRIAYFKAPFFFVKHSLLTLLVVVLLLSCSKSVPPQAVLSVFPSVGDSTLVFELNASESTDERAYEVALLYRWDFNSDQTWDTEFSDESVSVKQFLFPGTYYIMVEVMNPMGLTSMAKDSIKVFGRNQDVSQLADTRDGQCYTIVKLENRWWMAESLRYGTIIDPKNQVMSDNNKVERMVIEDSGSPGSYSLYSWYEAIDYNMEENQGICPDGWHIPTKSEWESLYANFPIKYITHFLGETGFSGLNLQLGRQVDLDLLHNLFDCNPAFASYWSSDHRHIESDTFEAGHLSFRQDLAIGFSFVDQSVLTAIHENVMLNTVRCIKNDE
jgi:uncharacterized protein (TIGR02145 family)